MLILVLSPYPGEINATLRKHDDAVVSTNEPPDSWCDLHFDWVISYGYRRIIRPEIIAKYNKRIINIHLSVLPWNRGADPNLWSWVDSTPKGVTIHEIDEGVDTGPIYSRLIVNLHDQHTLRSSYEELRRLAEAHFAAVWPGTRSGAVRCGQEGDKGGTYHRAKDKEELFAKLPLGWDTPVKDLTLLAGRLPFWKS